MQRGAAHRLGGGGGAQTAVTFGGEDQGWMAMRFPLLAQQLQGALGQGDVTVLVALAGADVQEDFDDMIRAFSAKGGPAILPFQNKNYLNLNLTYMVQSFGRDKYIHDM